MYKTRSSFGGHKIVGFCHIFKCPRRGVFGIYSHPPLRPISCCCLGTRMRNQVPIEYKYKYLLRDTKDRSMLSPITLSLVAQHQPRRKNEYTMEQHGRTRKRKTQKTKMGLPVKWVVCTQKHMLVRIFGIKFMFMTRFQKWYSRPLSI